MECPRCRGSLQKLTLRGGPYRASGESEGLARCKSCAVTFLDLVKLGGEVPKQAGYVSVERSRKEIKQGCPRCLTSFEQVYVEYEGTAVEYEECPRCRLMALDDGEIRTLRKLAAAAYGVQAAPEMVTKARDSSLLDEAADELEALVGLLTMRSR